MRISDWSSDVCSSDLRPCLPQARPISHGLDGIAAGRGAAHPFPGRFLPPDRGRALAPWVRPAARALSQNDLWAHDRARSSEEHTSEPQSIMSIYYAVL